MSMTKTKQYKQKFRDEWLENELFCDWLASVEGDSNSAYCKACKCFLRAKMADLINHRKSKKHSKCIAEYDLTYDSPKSVYNTMPDVKRKFKYVEDKSISENEHYSLNEQMSDNENNFDIGIDIGEDSDNEDELNGSPSQNHINKTGSQESFKKRKIKYKPINFPHGKWSRKYHNNGYPRFIIPHYDDSSEHELVAFGKSIVAQMKKLPEEKTVRLSAEIQSLVTQARIENLEEKRAKESAMQNHRIISLSYKTDPAIQSDQISTIDNIQI